MCDSCDDSITRPRVDYEAKFYEARDEAAGLRIKLNNQRMRAGELQEALDGMVIDLSLMESRIAELMGRESYDDLL